MKRGDRLHLTVTVIVSLDRNGGRFHAKLGGNTARVSHDGQLLGEVAGCLGGGVEFMHHAAKDLVFFASPEALWAAFDDALATRLKTDPHTDERGEA